MSELIIFISLMLTGYIFGQMAERGHYRSILRREEAFRERVLLMPVRTPPPLQRGCTTRLVTGSAVISVDYFKRFVAGLRNLFGSRITTYESLLDRARREAILRMQKRAHAAGATMVVNLKLETASISKGIGDSIGSVEVLAYGTAIIPHKEP